MMELYEDLLHPPSNQFVHLAVIRGLGKATENLKEGAIDLLIHTINSLTRNEMGLLKDNIIR